jgi:D-3-phosphoglycerate dehydrogenase
VSNRENETPRFKVVTPKRASFTTAGGGYGFEKEALDPIDAEIVEAPINEDEFIAAARTATPSTPRGSRSRRNDEWTTRRRVARKG